MAMMTKQFIPRGDSEFTTWASHFVTQVQNHPDQYDLSADRVSELVAELQAWQRDFANSVAARDDARAAVMQRDETRKAFAANLRSAAKMIQGNNKVTDAARDRAGLPIHKQSRTAIPAPRTMPLGVLMSSGRWELTMLISDANHALRRRRPSGVSGCEIFVSYAAEAPQDPADYQFVSYCTRCSEVLSFPSSRAGQPVHYVLRWVNPTGQPGPWSDPVSSLVPVV